MILKLEFKYCIYCTLILFFHQSATTNTITNNNSINNSYLSNVVEAISSISTKDERYSYSLTTFNPNGQLGQVIRAQQASTYGVPIICIILENPNNHNTVLDERMILMSSIQYLPSIFMIDDGTSRFIQLTDTIFISHSGISADGRILLAAAQRIVIEYEYTYNTNISISNLLQQLSLLYQQYTMKPGTRPFGSTLIIAHIPYTNTNTNNIEQPIIYQIDVSGKINSMNDKYNIINGKDFIQQTNIQEKLLKLLEQVSSNIIPFDPITIQQKVATIVHDATIVLSKKHLQSESIPTKQQQEEDKEETSISNDSNNLSTTRNDNDNNDKTILEDVDNNDDAYINNDDTTDGSILNQNRHTAILTASLHVGGSSNNNGGKGTFTRKRWLYDDI